MRYQHCWWMVAVRTGLSMSEVSNTAGGCLQLVSEHE